MYRLKVLIVFFSFKLWAIPHYYVTAADEKHFPVLINLIGSIHKNDWEELAQIAVFDLGLTIAQKKQLKQIKKVETYSLEMVHPDLLKPFLTCSNGRRVRGWFAWKPVVIKQALDLFPYVLYLDAGNIVLKSPENLFKYITQQGYFLMTVGPHSIEERITKPVIQKLIDPLCQAQKDFLLGSDTMMISANIQGLSHQVYNSYVLPVYQAASNLDLFADDGSAKLGFCAGRHDQTVFSIYAHLNHMVINPMSCNLLVDNQLIPQSFHWDIAQVNDQTVIYQSRWNHTYLGGHAKYIKCVR